MRISNLGFPRIGYRRAMKRGIESYWKEGLSRDDLIALFEKEEQRVVGIQSDRGVDVIPSNDFTYYDQMLDSALMLGVIPGRLQAYQGEHPLDVYFKMARGADDAVAMEMTKWYNTNYHYIVPEFESYHFGERRNRPLEAYQRIKQSLALATKPVLIGPYSFASLGKRGPGIEKGALVRELSAVYRQILRELDEAGVEFIQIDEPELVTDLTESDYALIRDTYQGLSDALSHAKLILQTYFGDLGIGYQKMIALPVDGLGLDFVHGRETLSLIRRCGFPGDKTLWAGIVDGRNIWRSDLDEKIRLVDRLLGFVERDRLVLQPSCSLQFIPWSVKEETALDGEIKGWLSFAEERLEELGVIRRYFTEGIPAVEEALVDCRRRMESFYHSPKRKQAGVREQLRNLKDSDFARSDHNVRERLQSERLHLPLLPTTTIGSFPQTDAVRKVRNQFKRNELAPEAYWESIRGEIRKVIALQEGIGLDVLVHGEFERSDMVDYFGEQLEGVAFIESWVQSYGTRYVRPPVIYGDVHRPRPMTVEVSRYAASLTPKPVKGMLTGPITILKWSFVREDIPLAEVASQIALAVRQETLDLEASGIAIIQIDEPAFREGFPLRRRDKPAYLAWAVRAFKLASSGVKDSTQIHTHMCYSEFNDVIKEIYDMDADVISIENSRSKGELLSVFKDFNYDLGIGPGVYDIHSPRVPGVEEIAEHLENALRVIAKEKLWVNPDCGLKTRGYSEAVSALKNMVLAARSIRDRMK